MKAVKILPESYKEMYSVDLQKDKKKALLVNALAVIIAILMAVPMNSFVPISSLFSMEDGFGSYFLRFFALILLIIVYMVIHEMIHGVAMKMCGTQKIKYGYRVCTLSQEAMITMAKVHIFSLRWHLWFF